MQTHHTHTHSHTRHAHTGSPNPRTPPTPTGEIPSITEPPHPVAKEIVQEKTQKSHIPLGIQGIYHIGTHLKALNETNPMVPISSPPRTILIDPSHWYSFETNPMVPISSHSHTIDPSYWDSFESSHCDKSNGTHIITPHTIDPSYWYSFESSHCDKSNGTHIITPSHNRPLILVLI